MDIDEDAFRKGVLAAKIYGYLRVPEESRLMLGRKAGGVTTEKDALRGIAADVLESMDDPDCYYVIGPGTTTRAVAEALGLPKTLLGVDLVKGGKLVAADATERDLLNLIKGQKAKIVVTVIGGQGHVFGRGKQQPSPQVIRSVGRNNIIVIATKSKLTSLGGSPLLFDTGDSELDRELSGYIRVTTGYRDYIMYRLAC
jgi:predicted polyphosphate/ATP-dependent NAD kinase